MVSIQTTYLGGLRCSSVHEPSSSELITDAPLDNSGKGESFSPTDLVATALGSCMVTIMGIYAERHELDLAGTKVEIEKHMNDTPRRIGKVKVWIVVPRSFGERHEQGLEQAALHCPVHKSLHPDIDIDFKLRFEN